MMTFGLSCATIRETSRQAIYAVRYLPQVVGGAAALTRRWAVDAGGLNSGMLNANQPTWDLVGAVHKSGSVTIGGMFQAPSTFGVAFPKPLTVTSMNPFITHIDSQLALDPCK